MKKLLAMALALVLALGVTTMAWAENEWTGSGTEAAPYVITTKAGLEKLATDVNSGTVYSGAYFKLGASITVTNWTPIGQKGNDNNKFAGTFDGNGQTVTINGVNSSLDSKFDGYAGFFGATNGATIKNLTVDGTISGVNVAGIVARMDGGMVENCVNKANVTGTKKAAGIVVITKGSGEATIQNCRNYGTIKSTGDRAGGIINLIELKTQVLNCTNSGSVTSEATATYGAGGVVGWAACDNFYIDNCANEAAVSGKGAAGGILGGLSSKTGTVSNCTNSGAVTLSGAAGNSNEHNHIGGVVGQGSNAQEKLTATKNVNSGTLSGTTVTKRTIAEDVILSDESYPQLIICKSADVTITSGKMENIVYNYGILTVKTQIGASGAQGINTQLHNYGKAMFNCTMEAGSIHSHQGAETIFDGGEYHFTSTTDMRSGLSFVSGTFKDLRKDNGQTQWTDDEFKTYLAEGAVSEYDAVNHVWTVTMPVSGVALDKTSAELQVGKTLTLTATVTPDNATDKTVTWTSSNAAVAAVDANGVVTAKAEGTATITATSGGKTATCTVTVKAAPRYYYNSTTTTTKDAGKTTTSPKTFDAGVGIYALTAVLSVTGMACVGKKKF